MTSCGCMCVNVLSRSRKDGHDELYMYMHTYAFAIDMRADTCVYSDVYNMCMGTHIYAFTCVRVVNYSAHYAACSRPASAHAASVHALTRAARHMPLGACLSAHGWAHAT